MKTYRATINIKASPETIRKILTDAPSYPVWDKGVDRIEGTIEPDAKITAFTKLSPNRAFPVKITEFVPGRGMTWMGGMPLGLFKGVRRGNPLDSLGAVDAARTHMRLRRIPFDYA